MTKQTSKPTLFDYIEMTPAVGFKEGNQLLADAGFCTVPVYSNLYIEKRQEVAMQLHTPNAQLNLFIEMLEKATLQNGGEPFIVDVKEADSPTLDKVISECSLTPALLLDF